MLVHANGECGEDCHTEEPLVQIRKEDGLALGMAFEEHAEECLYRIYGSSHSENIPGDYECECEQLGFSWSSCEGCGSGLGGDRFALTVFPNERA
jgi:hypothetical protein